MKAATVDRSQVDKFDSHTRTSSDPGRQQASDLPPVPSGVPAVLGGLARQHLTDKLRDVLFVLIGIGCFAFIGWDLWPRIRVLNAQSRLSMGFHSLQLGMSRADVVRAMGRQPDCIVAAPNSTVLYFTRVPEEVLESPVCKGGAGGTVRRWDDLPVIYAAVEVAFDASGHSFAHGFCAEGGTTSVKGKPAPCMRFIEPSARP